MNCSPESQAAVPPWLGLGPALNKRRPLVRYELPKEIEREGEMKRHRGRGSWSSCVRLSSCQPINLLFIAPC